VDQRELAAKRFNVVVLLIALGALGGILFVIYKAVDSVRTAADEAGSAFGLLGPPPKPRRKSRPRPTRTRRRLVARKG
jgi:hypothetical protein